MSDLIVSDDGPIRILRMNRPANDQVDATVNCPSQTHALLRQVALVIE